MFLQNKVWDNLISRWVDHYDTYTGEQYIPVLPLVRTLVHELRCKSEEEIEEIRLLIDEGLDNPQDFVYELELFYPPSWIVSKETYLKSLKFKQDTLKQMKEAYLIHVTYSTSGCLRRDLSFLLKMTNPAPRSLASYKGYASGMYFLMNLPAFMTVEDIEHLFNRLSNLPLEVQQIIHIKILHTHNKFGKTNLPLSYMYTHWERLIKWTRIKHMKT